MNENVHSRLDDLYLEAVPLFVGLHTLITAEFTTFSS